MKISRSMLLICILFIISCQIQNETTETVKDPSLTPVSVFQDAFENNKSNIQVKQIGEIIKVLSDDNDGARHQRMIVRLSNDQTLLIAHNIDLAPRVPNPQAGKSIKFYGEYEWNAEGGVIHWTHIDPEGAHIDGWLEYEGIKYQ